MQLPDDLVMSKESIVVDSEEEEEDANKVDYFGALVEAHWKDDFTICGICHIDRMVIRDH
jgi:hypothetical protein